MELISKFEIKYFRSLYAATFKECSDINLIFGRNDSGKSNVLRALNLFFNDDVDVGTKLDFKLDFSDIRRRRAQSESVKGRQFISVKLEFNVPPNYKKSLGTKFFVKRQWNIYGQMSETLPGSFTKSQRQNATRFLNSISYTYVPAIKGQKFYADLIERLYEAVGQSTALKTANTKFVQSIRDETSGLSKELLSSLGQESTMAAPSRMGDLYRSLDFALGHDKHSLMNQKGDGVKARHIPTMLRFIDENETQKLYIWGFEEPENSLDYQSAENEANAFVEFSNRKDTQIILTSHSPIFYLCGDQSKSRAPSLSRYFVLTQKQQSEEKTGFDVHPNDAIQRIDSLEEADGAMKEASLMQLPYLIRQLQNFHDEQNKQSEEILRLEKSLEKAAKPTLFIEGKNDLEFLKPRLMNVAGEGVLDVEKLNGTPTTAKEILKQMSKEGTLPASCFFLFDNDKSGRSSFQKITGAAFSEGDEPTQLTDAIYAWCLPASDEFLDFIRENSISIDGFQFPFEFLFEGEKAAEILVDMMDQPDLEAFESEIHDSYHRMPQEIGNALRAYPRGSKEWLWSRKFPDEFKAAYLKRVSDELSTSAIDNVLSTISQNLIAE